jgi:hypothetical protein
MINDNKVIITSNFSQQFCSRILRNIIHMYQYQSDFLFETKINYYSIF